MEVLDLQVTGMEEAIRGLQQIGSDWKVFAISKGLNAAAEIMFNAVEYYTPIRLDANSEIALGWSGHGPAHEGGGSSEGGGLKAAVRKDVTVNSDGSGGEAVISHGKLSYIIPWLEYGHRMVGHKPGLRELEGPKTQGGVVKPYPIYRPAAEASQQAAVDAMSYYLAETVRRNTGEAVAA